MNQTASSMFDGRNRTLRLVGVVVVGLLIWQWVLPSLARTRAVRERRQWLDAHGIEPAAFNATDHPLGQEIHQRIRPAPWGRFR